MLRLRTLGTVLLEREDGPVAGPAAQRRRLAMLALLAIAGDLGTSRDRLIAYLWPERDERARHLLNQTLYALRRELGADDLFLGTDPLRLNPDAISSDVAEFTRALEAGELERAVELHAGPFLDGFHLGGSEEFERWQESTRAVLATQVNDALHTLADRAEQGGDAHEAVRWWRRLATLDPLDAKSAVGLMRALARAGNRAAALQHAKIYEALVKTELDAVPDGRVTALATELLRTQEHAVPVQARVAVKADRNATETVKSTASVPDPSPGSTVDGLRRSTPLRLPMDASPATPATSAARTAPRSRDSAWRDMIAIPRSWVRRVAFGLALLAVLTTAGVAALRAARNAAADPLPGSAGVVVFPFSVHADSAHAYLGRGLVDLLSTALEGVDRMHAVGSREAMKQVPAGSETALDAARGRTLARDVGADLFVLGDVTVARGRLRIDAALYDARASTPQSVSRATVEGSAASVFALADSLAARLGADRGAEPDARIARLAATTTTLEAFKEYLEGQRRFREGNSPGAEEAFRRAVTLDSSFALGWYRLGGTAYWMLDAGTARTAAQNALRSGHGLPEREQALFAAFAAYVDGRSDEAERRYRTITATAPNDVEAWRGLAEVLFHYNWRAGRAAVESRQAWEKVLRADPDEWGAQLHLSQVAARQRRQQEVDSLVRRQLRGDSLSLLQLPVRAIRAFAIRDTIEQRRVIDGLRSSAHFWSIIAAWYVAVDVGDLAGAERIARVPTDSSRRPEVRALARITLAHLALARGRLAVALAQLDSAEAEYPPWGAQFRGYFLALPFVPARREELVGTRDRLVNSSAATRPMVTPSPWLAVHQGITRQVTYYVSAMLSLRLEDRPTALRWADSLARQSATGEAAVVGQSLARDVRAADMASRGITSGLAALARDGGPDLPFVFPWTSPFYSRGLARFESARVAATLGHPDEALALYAGFADNSLTDLVFAAPAHLESARLFERAGDRARARAEYAAFVALWRECDPALRPLVRDAEAAMARVGAGSGPAPGPDRRLR